ncbi:unnamed protein product [Candidula unifasciata]|uniref:AF4/FMR2 family member lilli n=1 Tax=Candidula unifasciata TaxID=100452 RepID=A0A8S3YRX8_9EUPU|nr:unnamed protein product [Candidula unifasciata]
MALDHLDAISKPPNLLSPLHSTCSPPVASTKPLPPFRSFFFGSVSSDKGNNSAPAAAAPISKRRDSANSTSSKGSHQSVSSSKKPRRVSVNSKKDTSSSSTSIEKASAPVTSGPESSNLPFNHYVNGNSSSGSSNGSVSSRAPPSTTATALPANVPPPSPIETQYVIRMRANSSSNPDLCDRERKLLVLIIRLQSFLNHRLHRLRRAEISKLKKVIETEQTKYHSSSTPTVAAASSTTANPAVTSRPLAPSPHQAQWNKNSTGTPSPMSPTPSPAGSVSSQGSCELVTNKIQNGATNSSSTPLASPSPGMVSVHPRLHSVTQKYFALTSHIVKSLELWEQADAESRGFEDFFTVLDNSCGVLTFHSDPPFVVRYMKHALRLLNL